MKKIVRRCINRYKNQRSRQRFEKKIGIDLTALIKSCEDIVSNETGESTYTRFRDLGGANNHGMLIHYSTSNKNPIAISKIEDLNLAEREHRFLTWQKKYRDNMLAAIPYGICTVKDKKYACFISSVLDHPKSFSYSKAEYLYNILGQQPELLSYLALSRNKKNLAVEIEPNTKIKSILVNLVSQFNSEAGNDFYVHYLLERKELFNSEPSLFDYLQGIMNEIYRELKNYNLEAYQGLVHGDFKQQNILDDNENYKVIDCQYYTYGIRLWDLSFLYSKDTKGFGNIDSRIENLSSHEEKLIFIFFYIIACLINVKRKRVKNIIKYQISPALRYARNLLSGSK